MKKMFKLIKGKKGVIFATTLIIMLILVFIIASGAHMLVQDWFMIRHLKCSARARYLAEAGISDALAVLVADFDAKGTASNFPKTFLPSGSPDYYDVTVIQSGVRVLLSSEGVVKGVSRTVAVEVKSLYPEALERSLATGGDITIKSVQGDITILGDIHANGDMLLKEQGPTTTLSVQEYGDADGKATCSGSYSTSTGTGIVSIADSANSGHVDSTLSLPLFTVSQFQGITGADVYSGDQTFTASTPLTGGTAGLTFVDGDATFVGSCSITGGFVATGSITVNNMDSVTQTHDANNKYPVFMCFGALCKLYGFFSTNEGNIVYAANLIKIRTPSGEPTVLGSVVSAGDMDVVANAPLTLTYYKVTASEVVPEGIEVVSWNR